MEPTTIVTFSFTLKVKIGLVEIIMLVSSVRLFEMGRESREICCGGILHNYMEV